MKPIKVVILLIAALGLIGGSQSFFVVDETEQALVLSLGKIDRQITEPGLYLRVPFYQQIVKLERRIWRQTPNLKKLLLRTKNVW